MSNEMIKVQYDGFTIDTEWNSSDKKWWGKEISIYLIDANISRFSLKNRHKRKIGPSLSLLVCSPSFLSSPNDEVTHEDMQKAYTQEEFDPSALDEYLSNTINSMGNITIDQFEQAAHKKFVMTEWFEN